MTGQIVSPVSSPRSGWRGQSIVEVVLVFVFFSVLARIRYTLTAGQFNPLIQSYIAGAMLFLIPIGIIWITRRDWAAYGFTLQGWREGLDVGMVGYLIRMISGFGIGIVVYVGLSYRWLPGALILLGLSLAEIALLLVVLRRRGERCTRHAEPCHHDRPPSPAHCDRSLDGPAERGSRVDGRVAVHLLGFR